MRKRKIPFFIYIILVLSVIGFGIYYVFNYTNQETFTFSKDGYAILLKNNENTPTTYSFSRGIKYNYRKYTELISFDSNEAKNVNLSYDNIIHYADNSLLPLKNVVGIDLKNISNDIIFYYNIYKNTNIKYDNNKGYSIDTNNSSNDKVGFETLLLRVDTNKFLIAGDGIRLVLSDEEIIEYDKYAYFEYHDGSIVKIYNNQKNYQTISNDSKIVIGDVSIDLADETISKAGVKYISLTNLIIDSDGNIDIIVDNDKKGLGLNESMVEQPEIGEEIDTGNDINIIEDENDGENNQDSNENCAPQTEEVVDDTKIDKAPEYKVTELSLSSLKLEAKIEIIDDDMVLSSPTTIKVVENSTYKTIYEDISMDSNIMISIADLKPDKEYTLLASATYKIDEIEYERTFISKIFRTKSIGVSLDNNYSKVDGLVVNVTKESYSDVASAKVIIHDKDGVMLEERLVVMNAAAEYPIIFDNLDSNSTYVITLEEILVDGVVVDSGYSQSLSMTTLKKAPLIGELKYSIDKRKSSISMSPSNIIDYDNGIINYRYEVFDVRNAENNSTPVATIAKTDMSDAVLYVDGTKIERWVPYTYRLVVEYYDNEKIVEYTKDLGSTMQLDGVRFPTIHFDESYVTWEQINGVIVIDDPDGAIISDEFEVVYKNSVDVYDVMSLQISDVNQVVDINNHSQQMTVPAGTIPIAVNNLRKHETYTFQVYGYVNLQDDSSDLQKVYIGSVFVQTDDPKPLVGSYTYDTSNLALAFSVNFKLTNDDAVLEASTLNDLSFYLYEGTNTNGTPFAYTHISDLDSAPYSSTIKTNYYDSYVNITPQFFNLEATDFISKKYTMVVTEAKDYTRYGNEIPIINNYIQIEVSDVINEYTGDPDDAITIKAIQNRNATTFGLSYDDSLDPTTVIGYNVLAKYTNDAKKAVSVTYRVHGYNPATNKFVRLPHLDKTELYNSNGTLPATLFELDYGTAGTDLDNDPSDTKMRRGNRYYLTFEVKVFKDTNSEETIIYPNEVDPDLTLRSIEIVPKKQSSNFMMYPSSSTKTTATWKYYVKDVDYSLSRMVLNSFVGTKLTQANATPSSTVNIVYTENEEFQTAVFEGLTEDTTYGVKKYERLVKSNPESATILNREWHYKKYDSIPLTFSVNEEENRFGIAIDDYYTNKEIADRIAYADLYIIPQDGIHETKEYKNITFSDGVYFVNYLSIQELKGINLKFRVDVYYDNGEYGYDVGTEYKALQQMSIEGPGEYYFDNNKRYLELHDTIIDSKFITELKPFENTMTLFTNKNRTRDYEIEVDSGGVFYEENYVVAKALVPESLPSLDDEGIFSKITPAISIRTGSKLNISALLSSAEVRATVTVPESSTVYNNDVYIELYTTDENGGNAEHIFRTDGDPNTGNMIFKVSDFSSAVEIDNLSPQQNYYIKFYVYETQADKTSDNRTYLYDMDEHASGLIYRFYTMTDVGVNNIKLNFVPFSYQSKTLVLSYNLKVIHGFDRIEYVIQKWNGNTYVDSGIYIGNSYNFQPLMTINISAPPSLDPNIAWGQRYRVIIKPYGSYEIDGQISEFAFIQGTSDITLPMANTPFIGISTIKSLDALKFRVTINDSDHIFVNDQYTVRLVDSDYNVLATIIGNRTDVASKLFTFNADEYGLENGKTYTFNVIADGDRLNTGSQETFTRLSKTVTTTFGDVVYLGTVTASENQANHQAIDVIFANSYRLSDVTSLEYFITNLSTGEFLTSGTDMSFNSGSLKYNSASNVYYYTISLADIENFIEDDTYIITMNFYTGDELVEQTEISYYYYGG